MEYQKAIQAIKQGNISPVYLLHGTESFLVEGLKAALFNQLGQPEDLDICQVDLEAVSINEALDEANAYSFFSDRRIVIVNPATFVAASSKLKLNQQEEQALLGYISSPNPESILIIETGTDQIDKRRKLVKRLLKETTFVDLTPLDEKAVDRYIQEYLRGSSLQLDRAALNELLIRVNYQLTVVMGELRKLETYAQSGKAINVQTVRQLVPRTLESDVFELTNAVSRRDIDQAIQIYQDLILMKNEPVALHALLVSQYRLLCQTKILQNYGMMEGQIADHLGVHPYRVKLAVQSVRSLSLPSLLNFYHELAQVDYEMKTGIGLKETHFYLLLTKLSNMS